VEKTKAEEHTQLQEMFEAFEANFCEQKLDRRDALLEKGLTASNGAFVSADQLSPPFASHHLLALTPTSSHHRHLALDSTAGNTE
jgi:hypothetical protein